MGTVGAVALLCGSSVSGSAQELDLITAANRLVTVDRSAPTAVLRSTAITGLQPGENLVGIDYRPATRGILYGLGSTGRVYTVNRFTGVAVAPAATPATALVGTAFGVDFNPTVDRIRVVSDATQNLRLNPNGTLTGVDTPLAYAPGDSGAGQAPRNVASAYTNNVPTATTTTIYNIDSARDVLVLQGGINGTPSPNAGTLFTVGALGVNTNDAVGFDISETGAVLATLTNPTTGITSLYTVNLATGAATLVGQVGPGTTYTGLAIAPMSFAGMAQSDNQREVGRALDFFTLPPTNDLQTLFNALGALPAGQAPAALDQLAPRVIPLASDLAFATATSMTSRIDRRLSEARAGRGSTLMAGGSSAAIGDQYAASDFSLFKQERQQLAQAGRAPMSASQPASRLGLFVEADGLFGDFEGRASRPKSDFYSASVTAGADFRVTPNLIIGGMVGYSYTDLEVGSRSDLDVDSYLVGLYGSFFQGGLFVNASFIYGYNEYDSKRRINFGTISRNAKGDTDGDQYITNVTVGYTLSLGGLAVEPSVGLQYTHLDVAGFQERGAGVASLRTSSQDAESLQSSIGVKVSRPFALGSAVVVPEVRAAYRHEFLDDDRSIRARFGDSGLSSFTYRTADAQRDYALLGFGLTGAVSQAVSLSLNYDAQIGRSDSFVHGVTGGARVKF